ncbi:hypothetical protein FQA39_LY05097 [Lamprigera yunnana]|nr:hypothetical protein FQA39_LY05097 [Lamprigera yunnana]
MSEEHFDERKEDVSMLVEVSQAISKKSRTTGPKGETLKERLAKAKDARTERILTLQYVHNYICEMVAMLWNIDVNCIIEGIGDSAEHVEVLESFTKTKGPLAILFHQQDGPPYEISTGRYDATVLTDIDIPRYYVTKGNTHLASGAGIIVYRNYNIKDIDPKSMMDEVFFIQFDAKEKNNNIVSCIYSITEQLLTPSINITNEWGDLTKTDTGIQIKNEFLADHISFYKYLENVRIDVDELARFDVDEHLVEEFDTTEKMLFALKNPTLVRKAEFFLRNWHKQIEKIVTQFQQLRKEDEFVGPMVEIEYWRKQLAKFSSVLQFTTTDVSDAYTVFLTKAKARIAKFWKIQNATVLNARNQCIDNVKYLYTLERYYEPLYRYDPTQIPHYLPGLLQAIRMVCTSSRYYNNTASITSILVKVSNQMITMCRRYLNCDGKHVIWMQKKNDVIYKIKVCLDLYLKYYQCFKQCQKSMQEDGEQPFDCSETYVFGKFETFKTRLERIVDVLEITMKYSILQSSTIEGIDVFANKFNEFFKKMSIKKYDALNHRQPMFDDDYLEFKKSVGNAEWDLEEFVGNSLEKMINTDSVIRLLKRFEKLNLECFHLNERYLEAIEMFQHEIEELRDYYNEARQNPELPRNMPSVAGRISWIRQLYKRIEDPMNEFNKKVKVMRHRKAQKCIQLYNALVCVFIHYEQIYHEGWSTYISQVKGGLSAPIIIINERTRKLTVNFDPYIVEAMRETEYMYRLDLKVPDVAQILVFCKDKILHSWEVVKQLVKSNDQIRKNILKLFIPLLRTELFKMQIAFMPGLSTITWTSIKIPEFCKKVTHILTLTGTFIKEVTDMKEARIDEVLDGIASINLLNLPDTPLLPDELLECFFNFRKHKSTFGRFFNGFIKILLVLVKDLQLKIYTVEKATIALINKFLDRMDNPAIQSKKYDWLDPEKGIQPLGSFSKLTDDLVFRDVDLHLLEDINIIHNDCRDMFSYFNSKVVESLIKSTRLTLDILKKRGIPFRLADTLMNPIPIFQTKMELHIPVAVINPSLDEIHTQFMIMLDNLLLIHKEIPLWGQGEINMEDNFLNYYKLVSEQKEVVRVHMGLQSAIYFFKSDVNKLLEEYLMYSYLWTDERESIIQEFCDQNPLIVQIDEKFTEYEERGQEIRNIPNEHDVGSLRIIMDEYKLALLIESDAWKYILGHKLSVKYKEKLMEMVDFIKAQDKILNRTIVDLEDCRNAMACLQRIRENFIEMDLDLELMEDVYGIFIKYNIAVPKEDIERIESLRLNFSRMLEVSKKVQLDLIKMQVPLQTELLAGIEILKNDVEVFDYEFDLNGPMVPGLEAKEASDRVLLFQARFDDLWGKFETYSSGEALFGLEVTEYPVLYKRKKEFNLLNKLYGLYLQVNNTIDGYFEMLWSDIDIEAIIAQLADFQTKCYKMPKALKDWPAYLDLKQKIDDFNETCPLIELMANKAMKDRHWIRITKVTSYNFPTDSPTFSLRNVVEAPLLKFKDDIEDICISAIKEKDIEAKLKQVIADCAVMDLTFSNFKTRGELLLKGGDTADTISLLEDTLMVLNSLLSNRYNVPFKKEIQLWVNKVVTTSEVLEKWMLVQNLWIYLEAVFVGGDISKQLPAESKKFAAIDKTWFKVMYRARDIVNVVETCAGDETMTQMLPYLLDQLETCQKSLSSYLESKRLCFPRFFFVSDPVLLEILGQSSDPHSIQPHLLSIFDAVYRIIFDKEKYENAIMMKSDLGEVVKLDKPVVCIGGVEIWLNKVLNTVRDSVRNVIAQQAQCFNDPNYNFITGFVDSCGQAGLVGVQILWTKEAEIAIRKSRVDRIIMKVTNQKFLNLLNDLIDLTTKDLTKMERVRYETMVTIYVHQRDIFDDMVRLKIKTLSDFEWQKQGRFYYFDDTDECLVKITDVVFLYQNEYLGITERLAITPLTDRCYITLAQAIWMNMGGAPAGPAGTGKTETTKDMGRTLGKFVVVFNCSDQMDFRGLGRIFKGLAQSGSWGCFDEFNRIELPVLSVAAQQIYIVLTARKERKSYFLFSDGDNVALNTELGIFLTMNPGYAGRQELPENLKIMFRSVAMMVPDRQIIIRVKLASCGFKENINLSRKFFTLYKLCEEQLSKQVHYDFGLRNILSVLRTVGAQKRMNPHDTEETTVMRVLRDMNLSKLVDEDEPLFLSLIDDMFPGIKLTVHSWKELQKAITNQTVEMGIINYPPWNLKVIQLYETYLVRHGLMVLGPTGAGKTKCIMCLMKSMSENGLPTKEMRMNPKAITAPQMFGRLDVATNDWTDGIFSTLWRRTLKVDKSKFTWLVLDGPVDTIWIENLNSVLDDNKTLTLANGDRIVMAQNSKLVFEPDNVDNASPATVSRMGMVFMSASVLPWTPILEGWLKKRESREAETFRIFFYKNYNDLHTFMQTKLNPKMTIREALYIRQCCDLLEGLLAIQDDAPRIISDKHLERFYLFAVMWSLGAVLELDDRAKLEEYAVKNTVKMDWPKCTVGESIFEYVVGDNGKWQHWKDRIEFFFYPDDRVLDYTSILVPNIDNTRTAFLIDVIAKQRKSVLLIGEPGTAKTVMIKGYLSTFDPEDKLSKSFNFSSATTPNNVQRTIESYVDKRIGTTYGPPAGKTLTIFIDDISMPVINDWGDQITNEIVRQLMEMGGIYNLDKPGDFSYIVDIQFIAAMIHPGGGRNDIPHRSKRQFCIFNCTLPSINSMDMIFKQVGEGYFCSTRFNSVIVSFLPRLIPLTRHVWAQTKAKMLPTPAKFHYVFNLRDLSRIWQGILTVQKLECETRNQLLKLWQHECTRVISDRFVTFDDRTWFLNNLRRQALEELEEYSEDFPEEETYWVDYLREAPEATGDEPEDFSFEPPKIYEEIPSWEFVENKLRAFMATYNENIRGRPMDLVFFHDAMVHLNIISRIIRTPRGNALLVGVGGSGKQSLTKLASFIAGYISFQISLTRAYNLSNFIEDMKYLYRVSGYEGIAVTFIFTDNDIKEETFLEPLNNVLSSGEIANLFSKDELDEMLTELINVMKKVAPKKIPTNDILYDFFISRACSNLHLVLCFSPMGEKFRSRAMKFPGLISGCTMDWFSRWPIDALVAVSEYFLTNFYVVASPDTKESLIYIMAVIQENVADMCGAYYERFRRQTYVTPKTFMSFLGSYKVLYKNKLNEIEAMALKMTTGLSKLIEAAESVDILRKELEIKEIEIAAANAAAERVLAIVEVSSAIANKIKEEALVVKERAEVLVENIGKDQLEAEERLMSAKPALLAAEIALRTIKATDIATVRKLGKPPFLIMVIMDTVLVYFRKRLEPTTPDMEKSFLVTSWQESLKVLADSRFLYNLQNYQKDSINSEMIDLLVPYFSYPSYTYENAKIACGNVAGLISWTIAMASFYEVNRDVLPLKAHLVLQEAKLLKAQEQLSTAMTLLAAKEAEVKQCQEEYEEAMKLKQEVQDDANRCKSKMEQATALIDGLSGERLRWTEQSEQFRSEIDRLIGDTVLLVAFLSYSGPYNQEFRTLQLNVWLHKLQAMRIPFTINLSVTNSLIDTATIGEWNLQGLPTDDLSVQNGIIVTKADRYPLLIDPQSQGKSWIKHMEKLNRLIVTTFNHKYFRNHIEDSVSLGYPMLIEDIMEELDPVLDNVMEKNYIKVGSTFKVKIGDKEVDIHRDFRMYITTKMTNPNYSPEVYARASIIDFMVTMKGLEDQLLGRVIVTEKKELEAERTNLIKDVTLNKRKMIELEANLLYKLTTTEGSLVDDDTVLEVLNVTRNTAAEVREKLEIAKETEIKINAAREEFRPVATRGSVLYFLITSMAMVNCMYQTSLEQFLERFDVSLQRAEKTPITIRRISNIIEYMSYEVYKYKSRGLYEADKYMFVLLLTLKVDMNRDFISHEEFQYLIKGGAALDLNACPPKPAKWITDQTWLNLVELSKLRQFQYILTQVETNDKIWKYWFDKDAPEESTVPDGYNNLDTFRKLLLIRAWCTDRTLIQSRKYIAASMGQRFSEPIVLNMEALYVESRPLTPLVCFLTTGADPTPYIEQLSKRLENFTKCMSMGQGQEVHARKLIAQAMQEGFFALLQNCHLGLDYMMEVLLLFLELERTGATDVHPQFRLWLTTEVHPKFPISLLQICIKFTNEPPSGIRAGLMRTYSSMSQDMLDKNDQVQYLPLIYAISFMHTILQERRKFGPLGWNVPYEFNSADWLASCMFVQNHLDEIDPLKGPSWSTLRYMLGEVQYGGRITDDYDKILLNTFAYVWFSDAMFKEDYHFYRGYVVLKFKQLADYFVALEEMSPTDPPQVYGLHPNADITYQTNVTTSMLYTIMSIQPKESSGGAGESREASVARQTEEMLSKVPPDYSDYEVKERLKLIGIFNPLNIFLRQEIDRMQKVISLVRITLQDLLLAIEGTIIMNEALRDALDKIYDAMVPFVWRRSSWVSSTIGFWFTELLERNAQFRNWCFVVKPLAFWMTGFFNPQGFLTAMRQEVTRAHKGWALDQVVLHNIVTKHFLEDVKTGPLEGVFVHGLFMDGAGWDRKNSRLAESINKVLYTPIPVVHIFAIYSTAPKDPALYKTFDTMWKPRQIGSKTLTFEMIEEKKILKIEDMSGNEVYLGWESVSEVWSLESVLRYRLSYSSGSNFKYFYEDVIRVVAEMSGDVKINIYNIINRLSEKSDDVCCMLEVLLFMPEKALFDVQLERRIQEQGQKRVKKYLLKKMWMLYAQEHWTKSYDLKSAVERLYEELGALEFDADHEAIYGMERYYTVQQCEELRDKYKIGRKVCRKFLQGKTCSQCLVKRISEIELRHFLDTVNKYIKDCSDSSSSSDEEVFKAVEQNGEETTEEEEE